MSLIDVRELSGIRSSRGRRVNAGALACAALAVALAACALDEGGDPDEGLDLDEVSAEITTPAAGAEAKPGSFAIVPPWANGASHTIVNGYGSGLHANTNSPGSSNDHHALDFNLTLGESVFPVASGTVVYAGFATGGWAGYGRIVFIDHGNGYQSLYAHLNSIDVATGASVTTATRLGGAGNSGTGAVHLHLALYHNASFQNSSSGIGPYGGVAVVPEAFSSCTKSGGSCENLVLNNVLAKSNPASCPYGSVQSRVHRDASKPWAQAIGVFLGKSFEVGSFHDGTGQLTGCCTSIHVTGPNGFSSFPPNLGVVTPPALGTYTVQATCGGHTDTATVTVKDPSCPYGSIQARVHRNVNYPWAQSITILLGQGFDVGSFHDGTGQLTTCCTSIRVTGPNGYLAFPANLGRIIPPARGVYTVRATCGDRANTATVTVN